MYEDVKVTFNLVSPLKSEDVSVKNNQLVINGTDATLSEYRNAITAVRVNGKSITGSSLGTVLFKEDGTINFDASVNFHGNNQVFFADGVNTDYTLEIEANGYPSITASVGKSSKLNPITKVTLNKSSLSLTIGKTAKLTAAYTPADTTDSKAVTFTSSNKAVAVVSENGTVTAKGAGSATITAKIGNEKASCKITVSHAYGSETVVKPATVNANGQMGKKSTTGGKTIITSSIAKIKTVSLKTASYTYDAKIKKPAVTVKDAKGKTIASKYYTVSYPASSKAVGKYSVSIKFKGKYSGTVTRTFTIAPKKAAVTLKSAAKSSFKVTYGKVTGATNYVIEYSTSASFKNAKSVTVTGTSKTITGLKKNTKYYVRVRSYKTVTFSGKKTKIYSSWSTVKNVRTKK